ncbi:MAG: homing endonuclease associated repeat-containing protein [Planctomycetaceae bacterium]
MPKSGTTDADIIDAVDRMVTEVGPRLTQQEFCRRSGISQTMIGRRFGGWLKLRERLGLPERPRDQLGLRVHYREDLVDKLRELAERRGEDITQWEFCDYAQCSNASIHRYCGSWQQLRLQAGLPARVAGKKRINDNQILAEVERVRTLLGRFPTASEYRRMGPPASRSYWTASESGRESNFA